MFKERTQMKILTGKVTSVSRTEHSMQKRVLETRKHILCPSFLPPSLLPSLPPFLFFCYLLIETEPHVAQANPELAI